METDKIETYVFMDLSCEYGNTRVLTGICLRAATRSDILIKTGSLPEPILSLRFEKLDLSSCTEIREFINQQKPPVCLIAHNGFRFDFIILKYHFDQLQFRLTDDVQCADSILAFYDIDKAINKEVKAQNAAKIRVQKLRCFKNNFLKQPTLNTKQVEMAPENTPITENSTSEFDYVYEEVSFRRQLVQLQEYYRRWVGSPQIVPHPPENDTEMLFRIANKFGKRFLDWVEQNHQSFNSVEGKLVEFGYE
ncbi:hypothetical protein B5X24_HaOG207393 [Helicoverpa armigera]|uniref:Exonuclease domain-containing protein n=1 Tax=Helicoverpa armigera TaxID=29058 RepID=A0A2W1BHW8_HELAM|nr:hypothetical protein B5X24_HaOG207393 [Helicoverpa armigera]